MTADPAPAVAAGTAAALASRALDGYLARPLEAQQQAVEAARLARDQHDHGVGSTAERALGLVAQHLEDYRSAERHLRVAVRLGRRAQDPVRTAEAGVNLAYMLARRGHPEAALRHLGEAEPVLRGASAGWLAMTRALVLKDLGRWDEALLDYNRALQRFRRAGDLRGEVAASSNRGVVHIYRGSLAAAEADLLHAAQGSATLGQHLTRAITRHNLGYVFAQRGQVPAALRAFDQAETAYREHFPDPPLELWVDRCELLLSAGLAQEAAVAAGHAVEEAARSHQTAELAEARLRLAQAALAAGDPATARAAADGAGRAFLRQRRPGWAALARYTLLLSCLADDQPVTPTEARRAARALDRAGWGVPAREALMITARLELARGNRRAARADLTRLAAQRRRGTVWHRAQAWHAEALLRVVDGRPRSALRAAGRGLDLVEEHRATLGATDLRARASARLVELAQFGTRIALEQGRAVEVLRWAERGRAAHLTGPAGLPPRDDVLAGLLTALRRHSLDHEEALRGGRAADVRREQIALEAAVRDRSRLLAGSGPAAGTAIGVPQLVQALGDVALVEFVLSEGALHAVTLVAGRLRLRRLGPLPVVEQALSVLPFLLRRLVAPQRSARATGQAVDTLRRAGRDLDQALLDPVRRDVGDRTLLVVPTGLLQSVPWGVLPSCAGRPVSVAPSARTWLAAATAAPAEPAGGVVLVAGPHLLHAEAEVAALAAHRPGATTLTGAGATVEQVLTALEGSALAHLATHGDFRADNSQFSALRLHDGPLTVYDLERLRRAPERVVLSACESGRSAVLAGDEVLGLAAAFLSMGTRGLVASLVRVPDAETVPLMSALHLGLDKGQDLSTALAGAQAGVDGREPRELAAAMAFVSFGCS